MFTWCSAATQAYATARQPHAFLLSPTRLSTEKPLSSKRENSLLQQMKKNATKADSAQRFVISRQEVLLRTMALTDWKLITPIAMAAGFVWRSALKALLRWLPETKNRRGVFFCRASPIVGGSATCTSHNSINVGPCPKALLDNGGMQRIEVEAAPWPIFIIKADKMRCAKNG